MDTFDGDFGGVNDTRHRVRKTGRRAAGAGPVLEACGVVSLDSNLIHLWSFCSSAVLAFQLTFSRRSKTPQEKALRHQPPNRVDGVTM